MSVENAFAGPIARARIAPKEPLVPLSVILMPPAEPSARFGAPEWTRRGTRPKFPGQEKETGRALAPLLAALSLGLAISLAIAADSLAASSTPGVDPGLGNLRSPQTTSGVLRRDVVVPGAPPSPTPRLSPSVALAGWHRERSFLARRGDTFRFRALS